MTIERGQACVVVVEAAARLNGDTPLVFAAGTNHPSAVAALLELGARADTKDHHGRSPLDTATAEGFDEVVEVLRAAGVSR